MKCIGISFNTDGGSVNFVIDNEDVFVDKSKVTIDNMMEMYKDKYFYYTLNKSFNDRGKETYSKFKKTNSNSDLLYWVTDEKELSEISDLIHDHVVREEKKSGKRNDWYWDKSTEMKLLRRDSSLYKIEVDG